MGNVENKRILKNTIYLYIRTIVTLLVSLYTSRVFLEALGIVDLGIYNVVGGVVVMLSFLNTMMTAGTQRFLSYELGCNNSKDNLIKLFSMLFYIHFLVAILLFILAETIGIWFFYHKLVIPTDRLDAAMWVYQFSILSSIVTITQVPYNASIVAHEKLDVFAYIAIIQTVAKLLVIYAIMVIDCDRLKLISFLNFVIIIFITFVYRFYCRKKFEECVLVYTRDLSLFKSLVTYSSWNFVGAFSNVLADQGVNILSNIFFGPAINASRAISVQVKSALVSFVSNFQMAANPQIIKSYAGKDYVYMRDLIVNSSKYSFLLLFFFSFPIILETKYILSLWLGNIPEYSISFCKLILINACIDCLSSPLVTAVQATGNIKTYQIIVGVLIMSILPVSYIALRAVHNPEIPFVISIVISLLLVYIRIRLVEYTVKFSIICQFRKMLIRLIMVLILPIASACTFINIMDYGTRRFIFSFAVSILTMLISTYFIGLNNFEKKYVKKYVVNKLVKKKKKQI